MCPYLSANYVSDCPPNMAQVSVWPDNLHLLILDDFLLNTIMDEREVKVLMEIMEKRIETSRSTIVCSQREPDSWKAMIMNDEVSANAIMKRATKHYIVVIQPIETS